jgi:hypothetical protein
VEGGRWKVKGGGLKVGGGRREVEGGGLKVGGGRREVEGGGWRQEGGGWGATQVRIRGNSWGSCLQNPVQIWACY